MALHEICPALGLNCVPWLAVRKDGLDIIPLMYEMLPTAGENLPLRLINELKDLPDVEKLTCCTEVIDCKGLRTGSETAELSVIVQAYVFYDKKKGDKAQTILPLAVYLPDSSFSDLTVVSHQNDRLYLAVNPDHIRDDRCSTEVSLDEQSGCFPDNNAKVQISTVMPTVVFYTLCLVPYKGKFVKAAITRHIIIVEDCNVSRHVLYMTQKELSPGYPEAQFLTTLYQAIISNEANYASVDAFKQILTLYFRNDPDPSGAAKLQEKFLNFLHGVVWKESGSPEGAEYGRTELTAHEQKAQDPNCKESAFHRLWIKRMTHTATLEVIQWLQSI